MQNVEFAEQLRKKLQAILIL